MEGDPVGLRVAFPLKLRVHLALLGWVSLRRDGDFKPACHRVILAEIDAELARVHLFNFSLHVVHVALI